MKKSSKVERSRTVGLDLGDRFSQVCVVDSGTGEILEEIRVATTPAAVEQQFGRYKLLRIALETGTHSPWVERLLRGLGHEVFVAHARKLRAITQSTRKTDRADARLLAELARVSPTLLSPIVSRSEAAQRDLAWIRARSEVVRRRTDLINHVRGVVKSWGGRLPGVSADGFAARAVVALPEPLRPALEPLVELIAQLTATIHRYDRAIKELAAKLPVCGRLQQVRGVGALTALTFVRTVDEPRRFEKSRQVGSYLGLAPACRSSGTSDPQMHITKRGSGLLRQLLVQSAHYILGPFGGDSTLRRYGLALAERGGKNAKKRAVVAVARRLAVLLHRLWITQADYEPLRGTLIPAGLPTAP